jgi:predicted metal-dependent hydrolase
VKAPTECIDYVILHELCHLKHPNHGREFFTLLTRLCPAWPQLKDKLNRYAEGD